jgi:hypothetical protein
MKEPFKFYVNNHTYKVESKLGSYFNTDSKIPFTQLNFIKQVRDYVRKQEVLLKINNDYFFDKKEKRNVYSGIKYFDYKKHEENCKYIDDVYEIDINAAYWDTALKLGIINDKLYKKGLKMHKKTRLAALGSLAKRTKVFSFDGKSMPRKPEDEKTKDTEYLWFKICEKLGETMYRAEQACGDDFLFYWVDGIYVRGMDAVIKVCESFHNDNYEYKIMKMRWVDFRPHDGELWVSDGMLPKEALSPLGMQFPNRQNIINPLTSKSNFEHKCIFYDGELYDIGKRKPEYVELINNGKVVGVASYSDCQLKRNRVFPLTHPKFRDIIGAWKKE